MIKAFLLAYHKCLELTLNLTPLPLAWLHCAQTQVAHVGEYVWIVHALVLNKPKHHLIYIIPLLEFVQSLVKLMMLSYVILYVLWRYVKTIYMKCIVIWSFSIHPKTSTHFFPLLIIAMKPWTWLGLLVLTLFWSM